MSMLQILLVDEKPGKEPPDAFRHEGLSVLAAAGFGEASEAIFIQRFDAVVVRSPGEGLAQFTGSLRELEQKQGAERTPVLLLTSEVPAGSQWMASPEGETQYDAFLSEQFGLEGMREALEHSSQKARRSSAETAEAAEAPVVFDAESYRTQLDGDRDLMVEIIDLFLVESASQIDAMEDALAKGDAEGLSRVAHTIKGSLGSLQAPRSRGFAQQLEQSALKADEQGSAKSFESFREALDELKSVLKAFRSELGELR